VRVSKSHLVVGCLKPVEQTHSSCHAFDWAGFSPRQAAQSNTLLDKLASRKVQFTPIPATLSFKSVFVVKGESPSGRLIPFSLVMAKIVS